MTGIICPSEFEYQLLSHSEIRKKDAALIHSGILSPKLNKTVLKAVEKTQIGVNE